MPQWLNTLNSDWVIAALTFALFVVAGLEWWTNHQSHRTTKLIERAYLAVGKAYISEKNEPGLHITVTLTNSGRLPATLYSAGQIMVIGERWPNRPDDFGWYKIGGVVAPAAEVNHGFSFPEVQLTLDQAQQLEAGKLSLSLYGAIAYMDGLGKPRKTGFGITYDASMNATEMARRFAYIETAGYNYMT